jgi:hypothetical protein
MASRDLSLAHVDLQASYRVISERFQKWFPGWKLLVVTTHRTPTEQLIEYRAGRSQLDGTRKKSKHNTVPAQAIDVMIVAPDGKLIDTLLVAKKVSNDQFRAMYGLIGAWVQELGLRWGGDWDGDKIPVYADPSESLNDPYHWEIRTR